MSRRSRARQVVLQLLYLDDLNAQGAADWRGFLRKRLRDQEDMIELGEKWFLGVRQHRGTIDERVGQAASHWKVSRMPPIDRNIIRLGVFEIMYFETPHQVAINEAIELAKRFGAENSPRFVNGVLDRIVRVLRGESKDQPATQLSGPDDASSLDVTASH
jgi:N utilization substance protein B